MQIGARTGKPDSTNSHMCSKGTTMTATDGRHHLTSHRPCRTTLGAGVAVVIAGAAAACGTPAARLPASDLALRATE